MLRVQNVSFAYDTIPVLKNISFTVKKGKHIALIGASGCGKSTLLKVIYGLLDPNQGSLFWEEKKLLGPRYHLVPGEENMKYLSQGFELQSYRTVAENIGEYLSNFEPDLKRGRINELLEIVELTEYAHTKVENLSGGQKQRVALARSLAKRPEVLLLDEPFGNIDNFRRSSLRRNLYNYLSRNKITSITATHDKTDILSFAEETIVLDQGLVLAKEKTLDLYKNPGSYTVASLFGEVNSFKLSTLDTNNKEDRSILIYPHEITIDVSSSLKATVKKTYFNGSFYLIEAIFNQRVIFIESNLPLQEKEIIGFTIPNDIIELRNIKI